MNELKDLIRPELLILVPVLYFLGIIFKKSEKVNNKFIPLILGLCGIVIATIYCLATTDINGYKSILSIIFSSFTQGVLCAGASVYFNQIFVVQKNKE